MVCGQFTRPSFRHITQGHHSEEMGICGYNGVLVGRGGLHLHSLGVLIPDQGALTTTMNISIFALASLMFRVRPWPLMVISTFLFDSNTFLIVLPALLPRLPAPSETSKSNSPCLGSKFREAGRFSLGLRSLSAAFAACFSLSPPTFVNKWQA
jgi:hypothetical protein